MPAHGVAHRGGRDLKADSNGAALMIVGNRAKTRQAIRRDPGKVTAYDQAQVALEIALYLHNFGSASTFAWISAGMPDNEASAADMDLFQSARNIVHGNCGSVKAGDAELILAHVLQRHRLSRKEAEQ
jgi:hypothetical protein